MSYIKSMQPAFDIMQDFINKWRAVMVNELLHDFWEVANDKSTWKVRGSPEFFIIDLDDGVDAGNHSTSLDSYKNELGSARELSFSRRFYLGSFVQNMTIHSENGTLL